MELTLDRPQTDEALAGIDEFLAEHGLTVADLFELEIREKTIPVETPVTHRFTPGLYIREIFMPKNSVVLSKIHKTEHPYVISKGDVSVWTRAEGTVRLKAPFTGITKPGTQRLLFMHEDTVWLTFHPIDSQDLDEIEERLIEKHQNPLLKGESVCPGD